MQLTPRQINKINRIKSTNKGVQLILNKVQLQKMKQSGEGIFDSVIQKILPLLLSVGNIAKAAATKLVEPIAGKFGEFVGEKIVNKFKGKSGPGFIPPKPQKPVKVSKNLRMFIMMKMRMIMMMNYIMGMD